MREIGDHDRREAAIGRRRSAAPATSARRTRAAILPPGLMGSSSAGSSAKQQRQLVERPLVRYIVLFFAGREAGRRRSESNKVSIIPSSARVRRFGAAQCLLRLQRTTP